MEQILVSIGVPTYNRPEELNQCLTLLRKQTHSNIEIIVSDNLSGKSNDVRDVVERHSSEDSRITFFEQEENIGSIANFQFVLEKANGEYFMWAADDDELELDYIEKLLPVLTNNNEYGFVVSGYDVVDNMSQPPIRSDFTKYLHDIPGDTPYQRLKNYIMQPDYCGKSKILWSLHRTTLVRDAFKQVFWGLEMKDDVTWAELPVEFRLLEMANLAVVDDVLFHANLLPSSEGLREGSLFNKREVEICRRSFSAYRRGIAQSKQLTPIQRRTLLILLKKEEIGSILRMVLFGVIRRSSPKTARLIKKVWMKFVGGK